MNKKDEIARIIRLAEKAGYAHYTTPPDIIRNKDSQFGHISVGLVDWRDPNRIQVNMGVDNTLPEEERIHLWKIHGMRFAGILEGAGYEVDYEKFATFRTGHTFDVILK